MGKKHTLGNHKSNWRRLDFLPIHLRTKKGVDPMEHLKEMEKRNHEEMKSWR